MACLREARWSLAVALTMQDKGRQIVNIDDYGADSTGVSYRYDQLGIGWPVLAFAIAALRMRSGLRPCSR